MLCSAMHSLLTSSRHLEAKRAEFVESRRFRWQNPSLVLPNLLHAHFAVIVKEDDLTFAVAEAGKRSIHDIALLAAVAQVEGAFRGIGQNVSVSRRMHLPTTAFSSNETARYFPDRIGYPSIRRRSIWLRTACSRCGTRSEPRKTFCPSPA